jgi:thioredoxin 1
MSKLVEINEATFDTEVLRSPLPVLVDFYAAHCPPCRTMVPVLEQLAEEVEGRAKVVKADASESPDLAQEFRISAVPTFLIFKAGKVVYRTVGAKSKRQLLEVLGEV